MFIKFYDTLFPSVLDRITLCDFKLTERIRNESWGETLTFCWENPSSDNPKLYRQKISLGDEIIVESIPPPQPAIDPTSLISLARDLGCYKDNSTSVTGVVTKISRLEISILVHEGHDLNISPGLTYMLQKEPDGVSYGRLKRTLQSLAFPSDPDSPCNLDKIFFGEIPVPPERQSGELEFFNSNLDDSQKDAVQFALAQEKVALIFGPPGTGKTTTVIEILHQLKRQNKKVLVTTPSNIALDNMMERLHRDGFKDMVRLGHPARTDPNLIPYTLESNLKRLFGPGSSHRHKTKKFVVPPLDRGDKDKKLNELINRRQMIEDHILSRPITTEESPRPVINYDNTTRGFINRQKHFGPESLQSMAVFNCFSFVFSTLISASREGALRPLIDGARRHFDVLIIDEVFHLVED